MVKEFTGECRRWGSDSWVRKIPWRSKWQPIPILLPGKSHGQRGLAGYRPWGSKRVRHGLVTKTTRKRKTLMEQGKIFYEQYLSAGISLQNCL